MTSPCGIKQRSSSLGSGAQPLVNEDSSLALAVNGEIYNHRVLRKQLKISYNFSTQSDCEVIIPLVRESSSSKIYIPHSNCA